jgi:hypothetical protein
MRTLLSCLALALLAGIVGCGEPAAPETPKDPPSSMDESASADNASELQEVTLSVPAMS